MRLILHIGTEKTGTTTVQSFLSENRARLREHHVLFPESLGSVNHRMLATLANEDDHIDEFIRAQNLLDPSQRKAAKAHWLEEFRSELDRTEAPTVVVSSEHLQSRLRKPTEIARLKALLDPLFDEIMVLIYLREPVATAVSALSTAVKYGTGAKDIPPPTNAYFGNLANHAQTIERWEAVFGKHALRVRLFAGETLLDGDLITDFIDAAELPTADYVRPAPSNRSVDGLGVALLARINAAITEMTGQPAWSMKREAMLGFFESHFTSGPGHMPTRGRIEAYEAAFAQSNEQVRRRFFPERAQLFEPFRHDPKVMIPRNDETLDRMAHALADMWLRQISP